MPFSRGSSLPKDRAFLLCFLHWQGGFFTTSGTWEAPINPIVSTINRSNPLLFVSTVSRSNWHAFPTATEVLLSILWVFTVWFVCCSVAKPYLTLCDPMTVACQTLLSMGFPRQEYWSGLSFPSPGNLPRPGIQSMFPALAGRFFTIESSGKPRHLHCNIIIWNYHIQYFYSKSAFQPMSFHLGYRHLVSHTS